MKSLFFLIVAFLTFTAHGALELGKLSLSGSGCQKELISDLKPLTEGSDRYSLPLHLHLDKTAATTIERKSCQFSLPVKVSEKESVQISAVSQKVNLTGTLKTPVKLALSVFASGVAHSKSKMEAETKDATPLATEVKNDGVLFETKCGKESILRGNLNAFAQGPDAATVTSEDLILTIKAVTSCP